MRGALNLPPSLSQFERLRVPLKPFLNLEAFFREHGRYLFAQALRYTNAISKLTRLGALPRLRHVTFRLSNHRDDFLTTTSRAKQSNILQWSVGTLLR